MPFFGCQENRRTSPHPNPAMSEAHDATNGVLPRADARRLSNQIARVYRGTFGARTGLRTIVRTMARQALSAGAAPGDIARALEIQVLSHSARMAAFSRL